ncbi:YGR131W-like protein [Lipomyces oligophaga]|uniref:YGR131W-like protein n=1 Tax=Lipomyces oligophaga TaxID=45792 RepID=UPI0034CFC382
MMFASVWGLVFSSFYGFIALFISGLAFPIVLVVIDFLTAVFAFAGATALAVVIRVHSCTNDTYLEANRIAEGSTGRCRKAQANDVFMYFAFVVALVSLVLQVSSALRNGWGTTPSRPIPAPSRPSMAQVA